MYRPQFAYPTPDGCRDEEFTYFFDSSNTPMLGASLSAVTLSNIPLVLDQDAPFYWRGAKLGLLLAVLGEGITRRYEFPNIQVKFQDPFQNDLSDGLIPATQSFFPMNPLNFGTAAGAGLPVRSALFTGAPVPLDPEIYCPSGSCILFFLKSPALELLSTASLSVTLYGVKRFKECDK